MDYIDYSGALEISDSDSDFRANRLLLIGAGATAGVATATVVATPARAFDPTEITDMLTSLGGLATAALAVVLVPTGIAFALKIIRRVMR